jgi:uncharacterized protein
MKLQPDRIEAPAISGYGAGWIAILGERFESSLVLGSRGERLAWPCQSFEALQQEHFDMLAAMAPELVLFGSGMKIRFPKPAWLQALAQRRIGLETMDTPAACRTYNILAGEGRHVVAALLLEELAPGAAGSSLVSS